MDATPGASFHPNWFEQMLDIILESDDLREICKAFVFSHWNSAIFDGAFIFSINQDAQLVFEDGFGKGRTQVESALEGTPAHELRHNFFRTTEAKLDDQASHFLHIPLGKKSVPLGLMVLVGRSPLETAFHLPQEFLRFTSKIVGCFVGNSGRVRTLDDLVQRRPSDQKSLTARQIEVLRGMAHGHTNAKIASLLLVSDSTVRHETMRIYDLLNARGRSEAIKKGLAAGLIR